jgi:hypothetical protein
VADAAALSELKARHMLLDNSAVLFDAGSARVR